MSSQRRGRGFRGRLFSLGDRALGGFTVVLLRALRLLSRKGSANFAAALMRFIGPRLREHRVARVNLVAAFPDKSPQQIEDILRGVWDNLGRVAGEFANLDKMQIRDPENSARAYDIEYDDKTLRRFNALLANRKPALLFAAHLGNWELPALVAHRYHLDAVVLYRRPNLGAVADAVVRIRAGNMGRLVPTSMDAPIKLANALENGHVVAMLVDQYDVRGVDVTFFGQQTRANPLLARLARQVECPIYGTRVVRLPGGKFRAELTDEIIPLRDADGRIDVAGTMQTINAVIEGWIREYPEQWLWVHRRWRPEDPPRPPRKTAP